MIKTIPKQKQYYCDICGDKYSSFQVFHLLKYKLWCPFYMHTKLEAHKKTIMICNTCFMNIEKNLRELAKDDK